MHLCLFFTDLKKNKNQHQLFIVSYIQNETSTSLK